jgi:hypothetical protein
MHASAQPAAGPPLRAIGLLMLLGAVAGCGSLSHYVSPRVTGRVLDAETHQPLSEARVRRLSSYRNPNADQPVKGGQFLEQPAPILTGPDGTFVLESEHTLTLFRRQSWYSLTLSFEHRGYDQVLTNYTLGQSTNTSTGEPVIEAGDILLPPRSQ